MHRLKTLYTEQSTGINLGGVFLLDEMQAKTHYNIGRALLTNIADGTGAVVRVGRRRLYARQVLDDYFRAAAK